MEVVIEIDGQRHKLVENKQHISCSQCYLEKFCSRLCQEPYGGNTICEFFKNSVSYGFEIMEAPNVYFDQHTAQYVHERRNVDDIEYVRKDLVEHIIASALGPQDALFKLRSL